MIFNKLLKKIKKVVQFKLLILLYLIFSNSMLVIGQVGQPLKAWSEGYLDIHHINTGLGDAAYIIMPDGTTMIIDAGDTSLIERPPLFKAPQKPSAMRPAGEWMGRYILERIPSSADPQIDYALITHFDRDHIAGVPDLIKQIPVKNLYFRKWLGYQTISEHSQEFPKEYFEIAKIADELGIQMNQFEAGRKDQFLLKNYPDKYPQFQIRNLAVNGMAWTGQGTEIRSRFPDSNQISENMKSTALVLRYGNFSYFTGGDLYEPMEQAIAWLIGATDIHVTNHHGSEANPFFLQILRPRVHIVQVWDSIQPRPQVFDRLLDQSIYPGHRDIFLTNGMWKGRRGNLANWFDEETAKRYEEELMPAVTADQGHIVIRVDPSGDQYKIYILDDSDEKFIVKSIHGPYKSIKYLK